MSHVRDTHESCEAVIIRGEYVCHWCNIRWPAELGPDPKTLGNKSCCHLCLPGSDPCCPGNYMTMEVRVSKVIHFDERIEG